jgi:hypothetical protein
VIYLFVVLITTTIVAAVSQHNSQPSQTAFMLGKNIMKIKEVVIYTRSFMNYTIKSLMGLVSRWDRSFMSSVCFFAPPIQKHHRFSPSKFVSSEVMLVLIKSICHYIQVTVRSQKKK